MKPHRFARIVFPLLFLGFVATTAPAASSSYDCASPRPESAGFHNMVLFGNPEDRIYAYHLPLFAGSVNGTAGHVLMHIYQALWAVELDQATLTAYQKKFAKIQTAAKPIPFFSIAPEGRRFKVPEMICNPGFSFSAKAVYGHVEGNPDYPAPEALLPRSSMVTVQGDTIFARKFDGSSRPTLTYVLFGTAKQYYLAHLLTDDESSFDQIVGVEVSDAALRTNVDRDGHVIVTVPTTPADGVVSVAGSANRNQSNNKWRISVLPAGRSLSVTEVSSSTAFTVKVTSEVYFNANDDLNK